MCRQVRQTVIDALYAIAEGQQGYFTAKQAMDAGYLLGSQAFGHGMGGNGVGGRQLDVTGSGGARMRGIHRRKRLSTARPAS